MFRDIGDDFDRYSITMVLTGYDSGRYVIAEDWNFTVCYDKQRELEIYVTDTSVIFFHSSFLIDHDKNFTAFF